MATFNVTYFNSAQTALNNESIFMNSLATAKRSAISHAPDGTEKIIIKDLLEQELAQFEQEKGWIDS